MYIKYTKIYKKYTKIYKKYTNFNINKYINNENLQMSKM